MPKQTTQSLKGKEAYAHYYQTKAWKVLRARQLSREPLCRLCLELGHIVEATVVNHKKPHKGDWGLFCDEANHESVCQQHHDNLIRKQELRGHLIGSDANGRPRDPNHPWNKPDDW